MAFILEKEALRASGIADPNQIDIYRKKLEKLYIQINSCIKVHGSIKTKAAILFAWLWKNKPKRYKMGGHFRFHEVIDAQLDKEGQEVGNCLGLTLLYNSLLEKFGVQPETIYLEHAFGIGPHVLTRLNTEQGLIDIDNIFSKGFDSQAHLNTRGRTTWDNQKLVSEIYVSAGNASFDQEEYSDALHNYNLAIKLNPLHEKAHLNRAIVIDKISR